MALDATSVGMGRRNGFFLCMRSRNCIIAIIIVIINIIVYIVVVVNSMHWQFTHAQHSQRLQLDPHLESGRRSVVEFFCGNSLRVKDVSCFCRGFLNVTLSEKKLSTTGVTQGNCYLREFLLLMLVLFKNQNWT